MHVLAFWKIYANCCIIFRGHLGVIFEGLVPRLTLVLVVSCSPSVRLPARGWGLGLSLGLSLGWLPEILLTLCMLPVAIAVVWCHVKLHGQGYTIPQKIAIEHTSVGLALACLNYCV